MHRRTFLGVSLGAGTLGLGARLFAQSSPPSVALVCDPADAIAMAPAAQWALGRLSAALTDAGCHVRRVSRVQDAAAGEIVVLASSASRAETAPALQRARVTLDAGPERLALVTAPVGGRPA